MFDYRNAARKTIAFRSETAGIGTIDELMVALDVLNRRHDAHVLEQLGPALGDLVAAGDRRVPANLKTLLKPLALRERLYVVDVLAPRLVELVESAVELRNLFVSLSDLEVEERILRALGPAGLRELIATSQQLSEIAEWLYGDCGLLLLQLLGPEHLRHLVVHGRDLAFLLRRVPPGRHIPLIEMLGWPSVVALARDGEDLVQILAALSPVACAAFLERTDPEHVRALARGAHDWKHVAPRLSATNAALLARKLGVDSHAP